MQSLRTRKPSEARPRGQRPGNKNARPGLGNTRKSTRVDDKIKKRMSMRYADISSPTATSVPAMPAVPLAYRVSGQQRLQDVYTVPEEREEPREDQTEADLRMLDQESFDPDAFLKTKMASSTEAELRTLQSSLQGLKDGVATDLQRNVFKNYADFVLVSKEVSTLENEMLEFKESLSEWKGMPSLLHIDDTASVAERRRNVRSSIADLRILYANQMQTLHAQIEGSSKYIPTTPNRHVVLEMDNISALNPATYKVDHSVRFVLLDDAVLVARKRKRRNNAESDKLVAERCWPLSEMLVLDTKDTASMTNVFKIRHNKETHVYRTEVAGDKRTLLMQFRHIAEELAAKRRKEREGEHQRRKSLWVAGERSSYAPEVPPLPDFLAGMSEKDTASTAKDKSEQDSRWIGDFSDDLTVAIALRKWEEAITLVEEGEAKSGSMPALVAKLTPLKGSLTAALLQALSQPSNRKSNVVQLISLLSRLNAGAAARSTFLAARSDVMRKHVRMITFEGDVCAYIGHLAIVIFTGIKHTADWFLASFKENEVSSSFVEWAKMQIEQYSDMFRKQVYSSDVDPEVIHDAIKITKLQSKKLLEEYGLDFRFLLDQLLLENPGDPSKPIPPAYRSHAQSQDPPEPMITPASTPARSRSPALPMPTPGMSRKMGTPPVPPIPVSVRSSPIHGPRPLPSPRGSPIIIPGSPASSQTPLPPSRMSTASGSRPGTPELLPGAHRVSGPRPLRGSPAPPPRSRDRPMSGSRPPPVAIPKRDGMI